MRKSLLLSFTLAAAVAVVVTGANTRRAPAKPVITKTAHALPVQPSIEALDRCVQARFQTMPLDRQFGAARMPWLREATSQAQRTNQPKAAHRFLAGTAEERTVAAELERDGWEVALRLGGRRLLNSDMTKESWDSSPPSDLRRTLGAPIFITAIGDPSGLPQPWDLWLRGQQTLKAPASGPTVTAHGSWFVDARPVRVQQEGCLDCHGGPDSPLKVGDAIGVAIYLYRRTQVPRALSTAAIAP